MDLIKWRQDIIPEYPAEFKLQRTKNIVMERIEKELKVEKIDINKKTLFNGDIVISYFSKTAAHLSIYYNDFLYHALEKYGVCKTHISNLSFKQRMNHAYRILI